MNDDGIFRNERPHEVEMPEGSHIAVSKSAEKTEPSVRKVFQEGEEFIDANLILDIQAPMPNAPSMTGAIEQYIKTANK